jgi:DNA-binding NarL/FixJ family response regulator
MTSVVVAEDQALLREGFRALLESDPSIQVVGEAGDGRDAVREVLRARPDVVLMDIQMPVLDGISATRAIVEAGAPSRVLILTTFDDEELVASALRAGASGFLLKSTAGRSVVSAIKQVAAGDSLLAPELTRRLIERFLVAAATSSHTLEWLTDRERDVLRCIGRGRSNAEIAAELYVGVATVKSHINTLFAKLGIRDRANAVVVAYESGLVRIGDP